MLRTPPEVQLMFPGLATLENDTVLKYVRVAFRWGSEVSTTDCRSCKSKTAKQHMTSAFPLL